MWLEPPSSQRRLDNGWNFNAGWTIPLRKEGKWTPVVHHFGEGLFYWECPLIPVLSTVLSNKTINSWVEASKGFYYFKKTHNSFCLSAFVLFVNTLDSMNRILMALTEFTPTTTTTWGLVWFGYVPHAACCVWASSVTKFPVSTRGKCQDEVITWHPSRGHLCLIKKAGALRHCCRVGSM